VRLLPSRSDHAGRGADIKQTPKPTDQQIVDAMSGNICRCGTYQRIWQAIKSAAESVE
jgi:isoquinoline 1-oxidoreductase subunit alpha